MKRPVVIFGLAAALAFGLGYWMFTVFFEQEKTVEKAPPPVVEKERPDAGAVQPQAMTVIETSGRVEARSAGEEAWHPLKPGEKLQEDESIRTEKDASAKLQVDEKSVIDLVARSELSVKEISSTVHRFKLVRGKLSADYDKSGDRVIRVESSKSDAVAEAAAGEFQMQNNDGVVSVATRIGEVRLTAKDQTVTVAAGKTSTVLKDSAPQPIEDIPLSVLLHVARPGEVQRRRYTVIRGKTDVGAVVNINGQNAEVDKKGRFKIRVALKEGKNQVTVTAEDVAGNTKEKEFPVLVSTKDKVKKVDVEWKK